MKRAWSDCGPERRALPTPDEGPPWWIGAIFVVVTSVVAFLIANL